MPELAGSDLTTGRSAALPASTPVPVYCVRLIAGVLELAVGAPTDSGDAG